MKRIVLIEHGRRAARCAENDYPLVCYRLATEKIIPTTLSAMTLNQKRRSNDRGNRTWEPCVGNDLDADPASAGHTAISDAEETTSRFRT